MHAVRERIYRSLFGKQPVILSRDVTIARCLQTYINYVKQERQEGHYGHHETASREDRAY